MKDNGNRQALSQKRLESNHNRDEISLYETMKVLGQYKFHMVFIIVSFVIVSSGYYYTRTPIYEVKAKIRVPEELSVLAFQYR